MECLHNQLLAISETNKAHKVQPSQRYNIRSNPQCIHSFIVRVKLSIKAVILLQETDNSPAPRQSPSFTNPYALNNSSAAQINVEAPVPSNLRRHRGKLSRSETQILFEFTTMSKHRQQIVSDCRFEYK